MSTTRFKAVEAAAAHLAGDAAVEQQVRKEKSKNTLVLLLLGTRIEKNLTQEDIAASMGCDPSTVSRIESGNDRQLKWLDIVNYASALRLQMSVLFDDESLPAAARIKQCVFKIDDDLKKLALLAESMDGDSEIVKGIDRFYKEVLFNFLCRFEENRDKLSAVIRIPTKCGPQDVLERPRKSAPPEICDAVPAAAPAD